MRYAALTGTGLYRIRQKLGMTEETFARIIRVGSDRTVRRYENGERAVPATVAILAQLALEFPVVRERLLRRDQSPRGENQ